GFRALSIAVAISVPAMVAIDILGDRQYHQDVRTQNVMACQAVANIVNTALGPVGLDKVLVELAELQDKEVGDGTTSVVIVAAELLKRANDLVRNKIHPTSIISGYRVVEAVQAVKMTNARGEVKYPIKGINILKAHGKSARDSYLLKGYALNTGCAAQGMPTRHTVSVPLSFSFGAYFCREADMTKERIDKLLKAGANVILTTKGIDDMALKASFMSTFIYQSSCAASSILRGANDFMLDEMERALHDALSIVKRTLESNTCCLFLFLVVEFCCHTGFLVCIGAVEAALSVYLEYLATTLGSIEQLAIAEFAESLLIIPKVLAVNAAKDATELVAKLRAYHTAQTKADKQHLSGMGLNLYNGTVRNSLEAGVIEPAMSKVKILLFATDAAITILRIDDMIKLCQALRARMQKIRGGSGSSFLVFGWDCLHPCIYPEDYEIL
ncbi:T-complex protein 1 subunit alpha-like protein, partial [Drosera capensis]